MSSTQKKSENINLRIEPEHKDLIEKGAQLLGQSVSGFVVQASIQQAKDVISKHKEVVLSDVDRDLFLALIDEDGANEELTDAIRRGRTLTT